MHIYIYEACFLVQAQCQCHQHRMYNIKLEEQWMVMGFYLILSRLTSLLRSLHKVHILHGMTLTLYDRLRLHQDSFWLSRSSKYSEVDTW